MSATRRPLPGVHSVLFRLILSYAALVFLMTITTSGVAFFYFQSKYNQELENFPQLYLKNIAKELEGRVVDSSKTLYMELLTLLNDGKDGFFGAEDQLEFQSTDISATASRLRDFVARNYDRLEAVHLYYVKQKIMVSSTGFQNQILPGSPADGQPLLERMRSQGASQLWEVYDRPDYLGIEPKTLFRSLRCYPLLSTPEDCTILISIEYQSSFLRESLDRLMPADGGTTALVSPRSTKILGSTPDLTWDEPTASAVEKAMERSASGTAASLTAASPSGPRLVTALPLSDTGWYLVNVIASADLYKRGGVIWVVLALICLAAIILGLAVSSWLSSNLYNPLGKLVNRLGTLFGSPEADGDRDEYQVIGSALDQLSSRMDGLEATIANNRPAIKNELVLRLLEESDLEPDEWNGTLSLLALPDFPPRIRAAVVTLASPTRVFKYQVADELEAAFPNALWASPMPGGNIGMIVGAADDLVPRLEDRIRDLRDRTSSQALAVLGPEVGSPKNLAGSFAEARELAEYRFLYPEVPVLADRPDLTARTGRTALPQKTFPSDLASALAARDLAKFRDLVQSYRQSAVAGPASVRACRADLELIALTLDGSMPGLPDLADHASHLDGFLDELVAIAADLCSVDGRVRQPRTAALADKIKAYVEANLGGDLSLDAVGSALAVSPGYMSKIFKEETGRTFVAYVTEVRLVRAAQLVETSRHPVQEIGRRVGIPSPAYFIRLFKAKYGKTPLDYRRERFQGEK